ncbi:MAG TPA: hypothetical protein VG755_04415 [Nannocystaceae bacterium]|nr:hypothetical protein [Nannocystaceae bacterium]
MRRLALVVVALASCFRGEFLEGTVCTEDSDCGPRFTCIKDGGTTGGDSTTAGDGICGVHDNAPPATTAGTSGTSSGSESTTG